MAVVLMTTGGARAAAAQEPIVLTLEAAVGRGLAAAPRIAEARALEAAAEAAVSARTALGRPHVTASTSLLRTNHVEEFGVPLAGGGTRVIFPDIPTNYRTRAEVAMPIFTSGRVGELVASASAERRAADADRRTAAANLTLEVTAAYYGLLVARERVGVLTRALERSDASLETVGARVEAGVLPPNDVLSAQAQRARQQVQLIRARNAEALAAAELARLVAAGPGRPIVLATPADRPVPGAGGLERLPVDALTARALASRPERRGIVERETALRASADAALSAVRPQVSAMAAVEPARPNARFVPRVDTWNTGWDLGVQASWAIWDGGRARAEHAAATAQAEALRHRAAEFDAAMSVELRQRRLDLEAARAALAASSEAVEAAAEARRVLGERFLVGVATHTDVLDADVAWLEAELERTSLLAELRLSEARLVRTVGEP